MGFFDKLKATVGVGGATIDLVAPAITTSNANVPLAITIRGGNLDQKLHGIDVSMVLRREERTTEGATAMRYHELWKERIDPSPRATIAKQSEQRFSTAAQAPACQALYADPDDYLQLVMSDADELRWQAVGPLPFASYELPSVYLEASADIPGAIDPKAVRDLVVLPESMGALEPAGALGARELAAALDRAEQVHAVDSTTQWLVWWSTGGRVAAWAELKAIASVRPEGVVRTYTNPNVPASSVLPKLDGETVAQRAGGLDDAFAWARELAASARLAVLPRPIGNAVFGLASLHVAR